ncbi:ABC transporter substrate-binding protein [Rhizobium sp. CG4]|jgi:iron complex transport system substrate-binding protein|uniref:ABC transporter substrate-binding protein n=1 Tax=Rhizobium sp. CG4 TaxID=2726075 RepID=UPI002033B6FF|nr:ABC transporter substrate-binding protein [Rhizobium sp. CG4]MCM2457326.1 ABC transporter substrate-binding protein [Rhizobium sp. CG4]
MTLTRLFSNHTLRALCAAFAATLFAFTTTPVLAQETRTITHKLGETEIAGTPARIVVLEFSFVQALDSLGVTPVGITDDNQPDRIEQNLGKKIEYSSVGTRLEPNLELISALQPDLIIADERRHGAIYEQLSAIAPTIVLNSWDGSYKDIKDAVITIADAIGDKAKGEKVVANHEAKMAAIAAKIPAGNDRKFMLAVATADNWSLHTSDSFSGSIFAAIGVEAAIKADKPVESGVGLERLVAVNPDVLLVATDPGGTIFDRVQDNSAWKAIAAAKNNLVFEVNRNQYARFRDLRTAELIANDVLNKVFNVQ